MPDPGEYTGPSGFAHLHAHSIYSALDGVATIDEYAEKCVDRGWQGMAITEHGHMGSLPDFYFKFREHGLQAIPGCEIYFNDWEPTRKDLVGQGIKLKSQDWRSNNFALAARINRNRHLTVLCKNQTGLQNLLTLTTEAYDDGLFGAGSRKMNRIWFDKLCKYKEGLIILSGCLNGPVAHELRYKSLEDKEGNIIEETTRQERFIAAANYVKKFKDAFGEDYYIELQMPGIEDDHEVFWDLVGLADFFKLKLVLANDSHYIKREDFQIQKIMMATAQGTTVDSPDLFHVNSDEQFFKTRAELWSMYASNRYCEKVTNSVFEEMCDNTLEIVDKCDQIELDDNPKYPRIDQEASKLTKIVTKALIAKGLDKIDRKFVIDGRTVTYTDQMNVELTRFISKGFASYFLITQDLIMFGKSQGWIFGPRGSAGGSLVCYLLGLSSIDPLKWDLSFDRFLSEARGGYRLNASMPRPVNA
jgi:DNA polymerase-3 subunit alpha